MSLIERWHFRWLRRQLERDAAQGGEDVSFAQVEALDGWSGWVTGDVAATGTTPRGLRRALHSWHVRWVLRRVDAQVASGEYSCCEEGDDIVVRPQR